MPEAPVQLTQEQLQFMTAEAIMAAKEAGQLHTLLTGEAPPVTAPEGSAQPNGLITEGDLKTMSPEAIVEALKAGRLTHLLGATPPSGQPGANQVARGTN